MIREEDNHAGRQLAQKGLIFHRGLETGVPDPDEAVVWYKRAVKMGSLLAMNNLGILYREQKDFGAAYFWFLEASMAGYAESLYHLGEMYFSGDYVRLDTEKAYRYFEAAGLKDVREACFYLGYYAENGLLSELDHAQAVEFYREGVRFGCDACALGLGRCCSLGKGVPRDRRKAHDYYLLAYRWGNAEACLELGRECETGFPGEPDPGKAMEYYATGAGRGSKRCGEALEQLKNEGGQADVR